MCAKKKRKDYIQYLGFKGIFFPVIICVHVGHGLGLISLCGFFGLQCFGTITFNREGIGGYGVAVYNDNDTKCKQNIVLL